MEVYTVCEEQIFASRAIHPGMIRLVALTVSPVLPSALQAAEAWLPVMLKTDY